MYIERTTDQLNSRTATIGQSLLYSSVLEFEKMKNSYEGSTTVSDARSLRELKVRYKNTRFLQTYFLFLIHD